MTSPAVEIQKQISRAELYNRKANTLEGLSKLLQRGLDPNATTIAEDSNQTMRPLYPGEPLLACTEPKFYEKPRTLLAWVIKWSVQLEPSLKLLIEKGAADPFHCFVESIINNSTNSVISFFGSATSHISPDDKKPSQAFKALINLKCEKCDIKQAGFYPLSLLLLAIRERGYDNYSGIDVLCTMVELFVKAGADIPIELFREMEAEFNKAESAKERPDAPLSKLDILLRMEFYGVCDVINQKIQERNKESSSAAGAGDVKSQAEGSGAADTKHAKDRDEVSLAREREARKQALAYLQANKTQDTPFVLTSAEEANEDRKSRRKWRPHPRQ